MNKTNKYRDELPNCSVWEIILWLLKQKKRFRVSGESMLPLLQAGEEVLIDIAAYKQKLPEIGDLVVARHPNRPDLIMIKRVTEINEKGYFLTGDNYNFSTDSRSFGVVKLEHIVGKVTSRFA